MKNQRDIYVNGRKAVLQCLDEVLGEETSIQTFATAFKNLITEEPIVFFKAIVMPLLPKEYSLQTEQERPLTIEFIPAPPTREKLEKEREEKENGI